MIAGYANSFASLVSGFAVIGFGIILTDALMNAQGMFSRASIQNEIDEFVSCLLSALGGIVGSSTASFCAYLDLSPLFSFLVLVVPWTVVCLFGCRYLQEEDQTKKASTASKIFCCKALLLSLGSHLFRLTELLAYGIEGSVAEWGSVYMVSSKEAEEAVAALVYGFVLWHHFCGSTLRRQTSRKRR